MNINLLKNLQSEFQYNLEEIEAQEIDEIKISSTKLRNAIDTGDVQLFKQYSGNYFQLNGKGKPEFDAWQWADLASLPDTIVPFKKSIYERVAREFYKFQIKLHLQS